MPPLCALARVALTDAVHLPLQRACLALRNEQDEQKALLGALETDLDTDRDNLERSHHDFELMASARVRPTKHLPSRYFWSVVDRFARRMDAYADQISLLEGTLGVSRRTRRCLCAWPHTRLSLRRPVASARGGCR